MSPSPPPLPTWLQQAEPWIRVGGVVGLLLMTTVITTGWEGFVSDQKELLKQQQQQQADLIKVSQILVQVCEDQKRLMHEMQKNDEAIRELQIRMASIDQR